MATAAASNGPPAAGAPSSGPTPTATATASSAAPTASSPAPSATSVPASSGQPQRGVARESSSTRTASPPRADATPPAPAPATQAATASRPRGEGSPGAARRTMTNQPRPRRTWFARCSATPSTSHPGETPARASARAVRARSTAAASSTAASHIVARWYPGIPADEQTFPRRRAPSIGRAPCCGLAASRSGLRRAVEAFPIPRRCHPPRSERRRRLRRVSRSSPGGSARRPARGRRACRGADGRRPASRSCSRRPRTPGRRRGRSPRWARSGG